MKDKNLLPGSVLGGALLIAGSCIGAGMLGLPVLLGISGFLPSIILLLIAFTFMTYTGLLLIEINGWFYERVNIISMTEKSFGTFGRFSSWILYLFLFYSLLVAYTVSSGQIISSFFPFEISKNLLMIIFVIFFSIIIYFGTKPVDLLNRLLMIGLIITYLGMIFLGLPKIKSSLLLHVNFKYFLLPIPVLITSFGFHNMIPSLTTYMKGDLKRTKYSILIGSFIALAIYLFWIIFVIGVVPVDGKYGLMNAFIEGNEATFPLKNILKSSLVIKFSSWFAFFAIVTSYIAQGLGLTHFIADGIKVKPNYKNNIYLVLLAILPPTIFAFLFPSIFFSALGFAGAYCAVILFGIYPALMAYKGRYINKETSSYHVKGGKISLILVLAFSFVIIISQIINSFYK